MKSIRENQKRKRGRPATGRDPAVTARVPEKAVKMLDRWAKSEGITRGEAMRRLIEAGLRERDNTGK